MDARQRLAKLERGGMGAGQAFSTRLSGTDTRTEAEIAEEERKRRLILEMSRPVEERHDDTE